MPKTSGQAASTLNSADYGHVVGFDSPHGANSITPLTGHHSTLKTTMIPYEFSKPVNERRSWYDVPKEERPHTPIIDLHRLLHREFEKADWDADAGQILSRGAKDRLVKALRRSGYPWRRRGGWQFSFRPVLNRYTVIRDTGAAFVMYAPDKRSIRANVSLVSEIHEIPNKVAEEYRSYREHNETAVPTA